MSHLRALLSLCLIAVVIGATLLLSGLSAVAVGYAALVAVFVETCQ